MGQTSIEWTDRTWNPTRGCSRVSEGCRNCYAERVAARFAVPGSIEAGNFVGFVTKVNGHPAWTGKVELIESKLDEPLRWKKPQKIFVNSMSDLFHEALSDDDIDRVFAVMNNCPQHIFQILTKRAGNMQRHVTEMYGRYASHFNVWPLPNVWLGVSVEDQQRAHERIPALLNTPAAKRFVSYEPALGPVDFGCFFDEGLECNYCRQWRGTEETALPDGNEEDPGFLCPKCSEAVAHLPLDERIDWIIVGGESGPGARPFNIAWAEGTVRQCRAAGVACFVKQLGAKPFLEREAAGAFIPDYEYSLKDRKGGDPEEWPSELRVREFPC